VIVQNSDDYNRLTRECEGSKSEIILIKGSGAYYRLPKVEWHGHVSDVRQIWQASRIACLPTKYPEGIPMSLLEAAACGRPILATDIPGCMEIVQNEWNGFIVPQNDAQALAIVS